MVSFIDDFLRDKAPNMPLSALADTRTGSVFMQWRDECAKQSRRQADYGWQVLARIFSWAHGNWPILASPCEKGGRVLRGTRADKVWTVDDEQLFLEKAPPHLHLALILALWTGQRQGD